jgi:hypothetical protein
MGKLRKRHPLRRRRLKAMRCLKIAHHAAAEGAAIAAGVAEGEAVVVEIHNPAMMHPRPTTRR